MAHLVVPGQVIASSSNGDGFLRGHGTFVEKRINEEERLVASVAGIVERVNKLISVHPVASSVYVGHVGDLVIGRISSVQQTRWKVTIGGTTVRQAQLPLTGVHLAGGAQRIRTAEDSRDMRQLFQEGDLVSAEVHNLQQDGTIALHTRSLRYGKLENGCLIVVPPSLIARRRNHFVDLFGMTLLLGTNGYIWIQRALPEKSDDAQLAEYQEKIKVQHAETPVLPDERQAIARMRNSIECLRMTHMMATPENIGKVYQTSIDERTGLSAMLHPDNVILLTATLRNPTAC
jgi:exosome complex component RRP4